MRENPVLKWDLVVASGPDLLPKITLSCLYLECQLPILGTFIIKGTSVSRLLPLAFRLARNLGAILKACWLPVEKLQQRVRASLEAPKGDS